MEANEADRGTASRVPALERGFQVLGLLATNGPATLAEIIDATDLNKSTAFYTLRTLAGLDVVRHDDATRTYALGPALIGLGAAAARQFDLAETVRLQLLELVPHVEATLVVYRRISPSTVMIADRLERDHGVRITVDSGAPLPIQGGSFGRAFLAFDPPARLDELLSEGLVRFTPRSTTSTSEFRRDLDLVRERGWAVDHEGFALGVSTVAAPVFDSNGSVALVVAAVGFTSVLTDDLPDDYGRLLRAACDRAGRPFVAP